MKLTWLLAFALVGACDAKAPAPRPDASSDASAAQRNPAPPVANDSGAGVPKSADAIADAGRYTSIDPARCRLIERNIEEGGYSRHACDALGGYKLEISESDLRQDVVVIAPDGRRAGLNLSSTVAKGAFNGLGKTAEWRGPADRPTALIVRLNVAPGPEPTRPDISNLVVARLAPSACVVAVVPPGPDQNATARRVADGRLPACIGDVR